MKSIAGLLLAAFAVCTVSPLESGAQWRSTAWTMDFKNDTGNCVSLTVGAEGAPPIDSAVVWAHREQHFDDNHTDVIVRARVFERADCKGRFSADLHERMHQLRNVMTLSQTGATFELHRRETPDAEVTSAGVALAPDTENGENFQVGPSYRVRSSAVAGVHLGDSAQAVAAVARALPGSDIGKTAISFAAAGGARVTVRLKSDRHGVVRVWSVRSQAPTPTARAAAAFARSALAQYGRKPTTQVSGPVIRLLYCVFQKDAVAGGRATCAHEAARLEVYAAVPISRIELQ